MPRTSDEFDDIPSRHKEPAYRVVCTWWAPFEGMRHRFSHQSDDYERVGQARLCFDHHTEIDHGGVELVVSLLEQDPIGRTKEIRSWSDAPPVPVNAQTIRQLADRLHTK